jgi:hypothetical protein
MRARHLLIVPAAFGLAFSGMSPATAEYEPDYDDLKAKVVDIKHRVKANDYGDKAWVKFKYKCEGDADEITTKVTLKQKGDELSYEDDAYLDCDGYRHWAKVEVSDKYDTVKNGHAKVTVKFEDDYGKKLDREKEHVYVYGVEEEDDYGYAR